MPPIQYLSQLLDTMPTDEILQSLYIGKQKTNPRRRRLNQTDLFILQLRCRGWTYTRIGKKLNVSAARIRARLFTIRIRLVHDLDIILDITGLFPK